MISEMGSGHRKQHDHRDGGAVERATEWLDRELFPILGPPALGPYDRPEIDSPEVVSQSKCPICGYPMGAHIIELSDDSGHVFIRHPDASFHEVMETGRTP